MKVGELIEELQRFESDQEVRLAHQPSWPLAFTLAGVVDGADEPEPDYGDYEEDEAPDPEEEETGPSIVWLVEGSHPWDESPYAPGWVFEA